MKKCCTAEEIKSFFQLLANIFKHPKVVSIKDTAMFPNKIIFLTLYWSLGASLFQGSGLFFLSQLLREMQDMKTY